MTETIAIVKLSNIFFLMSRIDTTNQPHENRFYGGRTNFQTGKKGCHYLIKTDNITKIVKVQVTKLRRNQIILL